MSARTKTLLALSLVALALPAAPAWGQSRANPAEPGARTLSPDPEESLQWAASVVRLDPLRRQSVTAKLFGTAGGDPAMNGLYTFLAFFEPAPGDGWRVFRLGDFLSYRLVAEAPGRLTLEVRESVMDRGTGEIGARVRRLVVSWRLGAGGEPPALVRSTPAR